jgi:hypothetical protein
MKQKQMLLGFVEILENSYKRLMETLTEEVFEMCPELQNFQFKHADDTYPYISIINYEKLKKVFNQAKKHFQNKDDYWKLDQTYSALVSFFKTQLIFQSLYNECYETAFDKIGRLVTKLLKKPEGFQARNLKLVLQMGKYDGVENSPLYKYAVEARKEMEQHQILHHKLEALKNLLNNALKEGKKYWYYAIIWLRPII